MEMRAPLWWTTKSAIDELQALGEVYQGFADILEEENDSFTPTHFPAAGAANV